MGYGVTTQYIIVARCRTCGCCADFSAVSPMLDLAKRFAEDVKQLQGDLGLIAKVQAQMEAVLKSSHGDCSQAAANLERVAAGANATPENNAENEDSDPETHLDTQKLRDDVKDRRHGKESAECETIAAGKKSKKKKKKALPETNFRNDVRWRCGGG